MKTLLLTSLLIASAAGALRAQEAPPALIPTPKSIKTEAGTFDLNRETRIICMQDSLLPLAKIVSAEIKAVTNFAPVPARPPAKPGDLILELDPAMKGEAYSLVTSDRAHMKAGNYDALAFASTTLVQLIEAKPGKISMPKVTIADEPTMPFRSALLDLARKYHSPGGMKQVIDLCRFYKIRYLHLNLADNELFMFPSKAFPNAGKTNREFQRFDPVAREKIEPYTREELADVDKYASEHGVRLIPELNFPGHSGRLITDENASFGLEGLGVTVNIASEKTAKNIETLINEVLDVFQSAQYFHLAADEVSLHGIDQTEDYKQAMKDDPKITSPHDLYSRFVARMNDVVKARDRRMIVWEEAFTPGGPYPLPKDVVIMAWNGNNTPNSMGQAGYDIVNCTWVPLYIVRGDKKTPKFLYDWNPSLFGREGSETFTKMDDTSKLLGAQLCSWENTENYEIQSMRERLAVLSERLWNPVDEKVTYDDFKTRWTGLDAKLDKIVHPIVMKVEGTFTKNEHIFKGPLKISLAPRHPNPNLTIRFTLNGSMPDEKWQTYEEPIVVEKTVFFRSALFDKEGKQVGYEVGSWFRDEDQTEERQLPNG